MNNPKSKVIPWLTAILVAVALAVFALFWLLPQPLPSPPVSSTSPTLEDLEAAVFERSSYQQLNFQVINTGSLPVQPPAGTGKANPFL